MVHPYPTADVNEYIRWFPDIDLMWYVWVLWTSPDGSGVGGELTDRYFARVK